MPDRGYAVLDADPFSTETLRDPVAFDTALREAGPLVRLSRHGIWATGRHAEAEAIFRDHATFVSSFGTGMTNIKRDETWRAPSVILDADPPQHTRTRAVLARILSPVALARLKDSFAAEADRMVAKLVARGRFDAAKDLAEAFPLKVLPDAVGLAREGREHWLPYANLNFNAMGPRNELYRQAVAEVGDAREFVAWQMRREALGDDGFGAAIYAAADGGEITAEEAGFLVRAFLSAGIDTTVFGIGFAIHALSERPGQWALLREAPSLARAAFEEALRHTAPSPIIGRTTGMATEFAGVQLGHEEKILLFVAAANRDPRRWKNPDSFDIRRRVSGHLAFGTGIHACVGQVIARLEAEAVLTALARQVATIAPDGEPIIKFSNWLRGFMHLPVRITAA